MHVGPYTIHTAEALVLVAVCWEKNQVMSSYLDTLCKLDIDSCLLTENQCFFTSLSLNMLFIFIHWFTCKFICLRSVLFSLYKEYCISKNRIG